MLPEKHPGIHTARLQSNPNYHSFLNYMRCWKVWLEEDTFFFFNLTLFFLTTQRSPGVPSFGPREGSQIKFILFLSCILPAVNSSMPTPHLRLFLNVLPDKSEVSAEDSICVFYSSLWFFSLSGPSCLWEDSWAQLHVFPPTAKATRLIPVSYSHAPYVPSGWQHAPYSLREHRGGMPLHSIWRKAATLGFSQRRLYTWTGWPRVHALLTI